MKTLFIVIGLIGLTAGVSAQQKLDFNKAAAAAQRETIGAQPPASVAPADGPNPEYVRARVAYDTFALEHARRTFLWQFWSGIAVFIIVMTTVVMGLWLSLLHFLAGRRGGGHLKISASGVEVSSPVIGLLILAVSLGFFYLYLSQVYPIHELTGA
jgi:hypothetical protein